MTDLYLGLGSNVNREGCISQALDLLKQTFGSLNISPTFESESVGFDGDNFYNLVVHAETELSLEQVIKTYRSIEDKCGRDRTGPKFGARTLDIDLLLYGDLICTQPIELPRDEILENAYVLWPLAIMTPDLKHPQTGKNYRDHWQEYAKLQKLWRVETPWDKDY